MKSIFTAALVAITVLAPAAARAQEALRVTEVELGQKASWGDKLGKDVVLDNVKFEGYLNPFISIKNRPHLKLQAADPKFSNSLSLWRTPLGAELDRKRHNSNVRVFGVARDTPDGDRYIEVTDVVKLPDDADQFEAEAKKTASPDALMALAKLGRDRADAYDDADLRAWTFKAYESALKAKQDALPKNETFAKSAMDIAIKFKTLANKQNLGIALLNAVTLDPATTAADKDAAAKILMDTLEASQYQGKWIPHEEFKKAIGYVPLGKDAQGKELWERRERLELREEMRKEREKLKNEPNPRTGSDSIYAQAAAKGEFAVGMCKPEVVRTKGYGFPDFVDRIEDKVGGASLPWDQWIVNSSDGFGTRLYFWNGLLYSWKAKTEAWWGAVPPK